MPGRMHCMRLFKYSKGAQGPQIGVRRLQSPLLVMRPRLPSVTKGEIGYFRAHLATLGLFLFEVWKAFRAQPVASIRFSFKATYEGASKWKNFQWTHRGGKRRCGCARKRSLTPPLARRGPVGWHEGRAHRARREKGKASVSHRPLRRMRRIPHSTQPLLSTRPAAFARTLPAASQQLIGSIAA